MGRLFDEIQWAEIEADSVADQARVALIHDGAKVIEATNVYAWLHEQFKSVPPSEQLQVIERCIPPFDLQFVEFKNIHGTRIGAGVQRSQREGGWTVAAMVFFSGAKGLAFVPLVGYLDTDPNGVVDWASYRVTNIEDCDKETADEYNHTMGLGLVVALMTFRFMHCANVTLVERQAIRQERRLAEREGRPPLTIYHTLDIGEGIRRLAGEGNIAANGIKKALHICRGHFADYTQGAGLFGKYKVQVFVPDHVRGNARRGKVVSDYRITPPADTTPSAVGDSHVEASA